MFDAQSAAVIFQSAHLLLPKLALTAQFAPLLLRPAVNANRTQLILVSLQIPAQTHTQLPRVHSSVLASPLKAQTHRRGDKRVRSRLGELLVQRVTKTAALIDRVHRLASGYLFFHPGHQLLAGKLPRRTDRAPLALDLYHDYAPVHILDHDPSAAFCFFASVL